MNISFKKTAFFVLLQCTLSVAAIAQNISLNGPWTFNIDPMKKGEIMRWHEPWKIRESDSLMAVQGFDMVDVPHNYSLDTRYNIIGKAWYRKAFKLSAITNKEIQLKFEAVFYKARVFINGSLAAMHEGGYTPFSVNITKFVKANQTNFISIETDNSWDEFTLPGERLSENVNGQVFPWYEFGGLTRDVNLVITDKIFIANQKIESTPNLSTNESAVKIFTWVENKYQEEKKVTLNYSISSRTNTALKTNKNLQQTVVVKGYTKQLVQINIPLTKEETILWDCDNPNLYDIATTVVTAEGNTVNKYDTYFGIRSFTVKGTQLLLNGSPIRMAGANRQSDHPVYGSNDNDSIANFDMMQMRNGNMIFSRLSHTPLSKYFYKWADEHGYLIIAEITNWGLPSIQMANQRMKDAFAAQTKELMEAFWNSPSIIAFSTGNEYESWTPEGDEWTRFQIEKFKEIDSTRLVTFVALATATQPANLKVAHNSFRYCDFLNFNNYSKAEGLIKQIESLHTYFPDKPIFVSETGVRSDQVKSEEERIKHLEGVIDVIKNRPYTVGFAYWSFNDYLSRYSNTNKTGYRPWGIVDQNRKPRDLYKAFQIKLAPVLVTVEKNKVIVTSKNDFPSYTISNHVLKILVAEKVINTLQLPFIEIGKTIELKVDKLPAKARIVIENKGGIVIYDSSLSM